MSPLFLIALRLAAARAIDEWHKARAAWIRESLTGGVEEQTIMRYYLARSAMVGLTLLDEDEPEQRAMVWRWEDGALVEDRQEAARG